MPKVTEEEEDVDIGDISPHDIELVMGQAGCTRAEAVKALRENDKDIVNAIMQLTMVSSIYTQYSS